MKHSAAIILLLILSLTVFSQKPKPAKKPGAAPAKTVKNPEPPAVSLDEKEEFEKAVAVADNAERIAALLKFLENFPNSTEKTRAQELVVSARAAIADEKLRLNETEGGVELFKLAAKEAPQPVSDKFFSEVLLKFPTNLFWRGQREAALEIARVIEEKAAGNARQMLGLSTFYLGIENAAEAQRLAQKALAIEPNLPAAYQTLGLAYRVNFQLDESATAYAKALEIDPNSVVSKRSLAEMKRAVGKPDEAAALYREILSSNADDQMAQTGLALALFDDDKRGEAEAEMNKALAANPNNLLLLVGAAYWYAAHSEGAKAVELAQRAVSIEPRYTWAHIALARGFLQQKQPLEAERTLIFARQYGNFPTLDYEIAMARMQAGFFREAAEELGKNFRVEGDTIKTQLGGRVGKEAKTFIELLALERRASIFQPLAADDLENANKLRALLDFEQKLNDSRTDENTLAAAADNFVAGDDKMKLHRQLFAAARLLQKRNAAAKAFELAQAAVGNTDAALEVASPSAAVLADELYDSRTLSISRNQILNVPNVPRQTLSAVLRGRVEELAGWSLFRQNRPAEAAVRLRRAISVLPEKSAFWRSSMWRLGAALEADGKEKEALDAYVKSYPKDAPEGAKYIVIETLYKKLNGNTDGLEAKIGEKPASAFTTPVPASETVAQNTEKPTELTPPPTPEIKAETAPTPETKPSETPAPTPEIKEEKPLETTPEPTQTPETKVTSEPNPTETARSEPTPETPKIEPTAEKTPEPMPETPKVEPTPEVLPEPTPVAAETPQNTAENKSENVVEPVAEPTSAKIPENTTEKPAEEVPAPEQPKNETTAEPRDTTPKNQNAPRPLFDPVVITIPQTGAPKTVSDTPKQTETPPVEPEKPAPDASPTPEIKVIVEDKLAVKTPEKTSEKTPEAALEKPVEKTPDENAVAGGSRLRVVVEDNLTKKTFEPCTLIVSQEAASILNGGGSIGVLVGYEKDGNLSDIEAASSSPRDVEITFEPEIGARSGRAFFVIKSISTQTGEFKITFAAPCGKKEINVRVR